MEEGTESKERKAKDSKLNEEKNAGIALREICDDLCIRDLEKDSQ